MNWHISSPGVQGPVIPLVKGERDGEGCGAKQRQQLRWPRAVAKREVGVVRDGACTAAELVPEGPLAGLGMLSGWARGKPMSEASGLQSQEEHQDWGMLPMPGRGLCLPYSLSQEGPHFSHFSRCRMIQ